MSTCCPCCDNIKNLGCFSACDLGVNFGYEVDEGEEGEWSILLNFGRSGIVFSQVFEEGDELIFNLEGLNENYTYIGQITKPNGEVLVVDDADCFQFTTKTFI
jgi:hypothetical protein